MASAVRWRSSVRRTATSACTTGRSWSRWNSPRGWSKVRRPRWPTASRTATRSTTCARTRRTWRPLAGCLRRARCSPEPVLGRHAVDEGDDVRRETRLAWTDRAGSPTPEQSKPLSVPSQHGLGRDQQQGMAPLAIEASEQHEQASLVDAKRRALDGARSGTTVTSNAPGMWARRACRAATSTLNAPISSAPAPSVRSRLRSSILSASISVRC